MNLKAIAFFLLGVCIIINCTMILLYGIEGNKLSSQYIFIPIYVMIFLWLPAVLMILYIGQLKFISTNKSGKTILLVGLSCVSFIAFFIYAGYFIE
jgi:hypothetical protein